MTNDIARAVMANLSAKKKGSYSLEDRGSGLSEQENRLLKDIIRGRAPVKAPGICQLAFICL